MGLKDSIKRLYKYYRCKIRNRKRIEELNWKCSEESKGNLDGTTFVKDNILYIRDKELGIVPFFEFGAKPLKSLGLEFETYTWKPLDIRNLPVERKKVRVHKYAEKGKYNNSNSGVTRPIDNRVR